MTTKKEYAVIDENLKVVSRHERPSLALKKSEKAEGKTRAVKVFVDDGREKGRVLSGYQNSEDGGENAMCGYGVYTFNTQKK